MSYYVYWGSGTAYCTFSADAWCSTTYPERKDDTARFTAYLDESEAKDSEDAAREFIAIRARNRAHSDDACWRVKSMDYDIDYKKVD